MLYDSVTIEVEAGAGGSGCVSFRREANVPKGGPDGGDGGGGGDIVIVADRQLRDLSGFRHKRQHKAERGAHGQGSQRDGADGDTLELRVPCGTVVHDVDRDANYDLTRHGTRVTVASGGAGGRGNRRFTNSRRQAPRFAERGLAGEKTTLELRLKLLADIGLVGLPNAGKSSLLAALTRAQPKIADYPFTTLEPALGTIEHPDGGQLVIADIPGLIEGASDGAGLGDEFLAHIERTRLLVCVLDVAPIDKTSPAKAFATVRSELAGYGAGLERLPFVVALSKIDLIDPDQRESLELEWRDRLASEPNVCRDGSDRGAVIATSSATGEGLDRLVATIFGQLPPAAEADDAAETDPIAEHALYRPRPKGGFDVARSGDHIYRVDGPSIEQLVARHDLENQDALAYIEERLREMGVISALEAKGFEPGDEIEIGEAAFALYPGVPQNG